MRAGKTDRGAEIDPCCGLAFADASTRRLNYMARRWLGVQKERIAFGQAGLPGYEEALRAVEVGLERDLGRELRGHVLWPWLSQLKGLGGVRTAWLLGLIRDPWLFPGQQCSKRHYMRPGVAVEGEACPVKVKAKDKPPEPCGGVVGPVRGSTGARSLWHYLGLYPGAKKQRGIQCSWNPEAKGLLLGPLGLAAQIVAHRTQPYRELYDEFKGRRSAETGLEAEGERDRLPPIAIEYRARTVAVKAFVADLLVEWKRCSVPAEGEVELDAWFGGGAARDREAQR